MDLRYLIQQVPDTLRIDRKISILVHRSGTRRACEQLVAGSSVRAADVGRALQMLTEMRRGPELDWAQRIEGERRRLLRCADPLDDGSCGSGVPFDKGISIGRACLASKPARQALLLGLLVRTINPSRVLELGTNLGISSAYLSAALKLNGGGGSVVTLDASPNRQRVARDVHARLGIDCITYVCGLFTDTLLPTLDKVGAVDLVFVDGHHQYQPTLDYFETILAYSRPGTVFVFDDIRWSEGMRKAWLRLRADDRLGVVVDLVRLGIGIVHPGPASRRISVGPVHCL